MWAKLAANTAWARGTPCPFAVLAVLAQQSASQADLSFAYNFPTTWLLFSRAADIPTLPWVVEVPLQQTSFLIGGLPLRRAQALLCARQSIGLLMRAGKVGHPGLPDYAALCAPLCSGARFAYLTTERCCCLQACLIALQMTWPVHQIAAGLALACPVHLAVAAVAWAVSAGIEVCAMADGNLPLTCELACRCWTSSSCTAGCSQRLCLPEQLAAAY